MASAFPYTILEKEKLYIIQLFGPLPEEPPLEFHQELAKILLIPRNVLVNCFCLDNLPASWILTLSCLSFQAQCLNKKLGLLFWTGEDPGQGLKHYGELKEFLLDFESEGKVANFHFLKAFIFSTLHALMVQSHTPSNRKDLFLRKDNDGTLMGDVNAIIQVTSDNYFYVVALSFPEPTFLKVVSNMLHESFEQVSEHIQDGAATLSEMILGQAKKIVNFGKEKIDYITPKTVLGRTVPLEKFTFQNKDWIPFKEGMSIVLHFTSSCGDYYVEIWFPREYKLIILNTLKT